MKPKGTGEKSDNRLWVVLAMAAVLLVIALVRLAPEAPPSVVSLLARKERLSLVVQGDESLMLAATSAVAQPRFAPLFFSPIAINGADISLLMTLPTIGQGLAQRIVDFRLEHGPFKDIDDFGRIPGIGPKRRALLQDKIFFTENSEQGQNER